LLYLPIGAPDLARQRLASEDLLLARPDGHPATGCVNVALADVAGEPFILPELHDEPGLHAAVTTLFADAAIAPGSPQVVRRGLLAECGVAAALPVRSGQVPAVAGRWRAQPEIDERVVVTGSPGEDTPGRSNRTRAPGAAVDRDLGSLRDHDGSDWTVLTEAAAGSATGDNVLADAVRAGRESLGGRLLAAYALGSLAHGGFSPLVSDVDVALILADPVRLSDPAVLLNMAEDVRSAGSRLHTRLSVFWGTPLPRLAAVALGQMDVKTGPFSSMCRRSSSSSATVATPQLRP
jgi:hypothetical protein